MPTSRTGTAKWKQIVRRRRRAALREGITRCPICRQQLDYTTSNQPNSVEVDHIVPHALGGPDTFENSRVLCHRCNRSAGGRLGRAKQLRASRPHMTEVSRVEFDGSGW